MKGRIQGSEGRSSKNRENREYRNSPTLLLKIPNPPLLPVGLEVDLGRADDRLAVKALEDFECLVRSFWRSNFVIL